MDKFCPQESGSYRQAINSVLAALKLLNRSAKKPLGTWAGDLVLRRTLVDFILQSHRIQAAVIAHGMRR